METQLKKLNQKLKESEEKFRILSEQSNLGISIVQNDRIKYMNQKLANLLGYTIEEFKSWQPREYAKAIHPEDKEYVIEQGRRKQFGNDDCVHHYQARLIKSTGEIIWVDNYSTTIIYNERPAILATIIDITEKKKAEQKLKESEEKYRYIFENTYFAIILINLDGIITDCNPSTERITGYKKTELINTKFRELSGIHEKYLNMIDKFFRKIFDGEIAHSINIEFIKKDGSIIWANIQASIVDIGEERFMIMLIHDVSESKRAEFLVKEEIRKLMDLDQIRKNLILRVSHELKTPLIPICSGTEFLLYKYEKQLGEEVRDIIKMIEKGGTRLKMLVNKLLDLSSLEYDMLSLEKQTSDLSELIKKSSDDMMHLVKNRDLTLNLDIPDNLYMDIDADRVEQVITNLLSNAIKNTPPKGKISISLRKEKNLVKFSVADTGVGLTEEEMSKVFTRFGKIERHDKGLEYIDIQGSGLGLFISKEIIDLHGGKIWASSEGRNKGSNFYFSLPIIEKYF